jgi:hypothetical protein
MPKKASLWTTTGSSIDMFSNVHAYEKQFFRIIIESSSEKCIGK